MAATEQICPNWYLPHSSKSILSQTFITHQAFCMKNFFKCTCGDLIKISEKAQHEETMHSRQTCVNCGLSDLRYILKSHDCPRKPRLCTFCEGEFGIDMFADHAEMCGSRTNPCEKCGKLVVMKDLQKHKDSNCRQIEEMKSTAKSTIKPPGKRVEKARDYYHYTVAVKITRPARTSPEQLLQATSVPISSSPPHSPPRYRSYF